MKLFGLMVSGENEFMLSAIGGEHANQVLNGVLARLYLQ